MRGLEALFAVSQHISRTNGLASFFGALTETIARLTGAERAAFWTLRLDNTLVVQPEAFGFPEAVVARLQRVPVRFDAVEDVDDMVHGDPIWHVARRSCDDLPRRAPWLDVEGVSEGVVVPWRVGELRLGLLGVYDSRRPHGFSESDVRVARIAALAAGLVWQERQAAGRLVEVERQQTGRLRAYAERMAALEKLKSNVLNLAAHELRGPLAVMRGYLSMLEDGSIEGPEEVARVRPILSAKARQMANLVDEMLETARLEDGRIELRMECMDIREVVQEVVDAALPQLVSGQTLVVQQAREPVFVIGDRLRLRAIVSNLIENAIKYSPAGGPIRCSVAIERSAAVVRVLDHGIGIAESDLPLLFTRFGRAVTGENSNIPGTGLGLYLSRELALLHGGDIAVESRQGVGSAFDLVLPRCAPRHQGAASRDRAGYDITRFGLSDMIACGAELRRLGAEAASFDLAAGRIVRHLYNHLRQGCQPDAERAAPLVRMFRTLPYARLDPAHQELARAALGKLEPDPSTLSLCLVATAGERAEWNDVRSSTGHRVMPLPTGGRLSPMISRLVTDLGVEPGRVRDPELFVDLVERTCNVFHVPDARDSPYVPDQAEFVRPYGIRSVLGFGGVLAPMDVYVVILFSRAPISRGAAALFRAVSHSGKLALRRFAGPNGALAGSLDDGPERTSPPPDLAPLAQAPRSA